MRAGGFHPPGPDASIGIIGKTYLGVPAVQAAAPEHEAAPAVAAE